MLRETGKASENASGKTLTFWMNHELFGIPISHIVQIIGMQEIHPIPEFPTYAKGVFNLRGTILPVIDLRLRLGLEEGAYTARSCILIVSMQECTIGLLVEEIDEVLDFRGREINAMPHGVTGPHGGYLSGVGKKGKKLVLMLDVDRILSEEQLHFLQNSMNSGPI